MRVEAAADHERLRAPTASSAAEAQRPAGAFKPLHGYSTADVLRDQRFRVHAAPANAPVPPLLQLSALAACDTVTAARALVCTGKQLYRMSPCRFA